MPTTIAQRLAEFSAALLAQPPAAPAPAAPAPAAPAPPTTPPPAPPTGVVVAWRAGQPIAAGQWQPAPKKKGFYRLVAGTTVRELEASLRPADSGTGMELALRIWSQVGRGAVTTDVLEIQAVTDANAKAAIDQLAPRVRQQFGLPADAPLFMDTRKAPKLPGTGKAAAETPETPPEATP